MDLLSLITKRKTNLKHCRTVVTNTLGQKYEIIDGKKKELAHVLPFVVDEKPDLDIACILPGLFLSSQDPAVNIDILKEHNIRHILTIGINVTLKYDDITYYSCDLLDLPESDILPAIRKCIKIIHKNRQENILVHCNAGVSRSPAIIIAYLIVSNNMSYDNAFQMVKAARKCIKPNEGFVKQLETLQFCNMLL